MYIVTVKVKSAAQRKDVLTYAMLDNCSQESFIQEPLVKKMQTSGRKTTLNLKTLNGERSECTIAVDGLQVAGSKDGNMWIKDKITKDLYQKAFAYCQERSCNTREN